MHKENELETISSGQMIEVGLWPIKEQEILRNDGALIYLSTGKTIRSQQLAGKPFYYVAHRSHGFAADGIKRLFDTPSRLTQVAIYPNPELFFIPKSFKQYMPDQQRLVLADLEDTKERLGLENLAQTLPEASEGTEIVFKHFYATGEKLLGKKYQYRWMRTSTTTIASESYYPHKMVAHVGDWSECGLVVDHFGALDRISDLGAARWLTPAKTTLIALHEWSLLLNQT